MQSNLGLGSTPQMPDARCWESLLDLGFEKFCRVGSSKKVAKRVRPFERKASTTEDMTPVCGVTCVSSVSEEWRSLMLWHMLRRRKLDKK